MHAPALAPRRLVDRFVEEVIVLPKADRGELRRVEYFPDGRARLAFRWFGGTTGDLSIRGPLMRAHYKHGSGFPACVIVSFKPGSAYPFFGVPVDHLTDRLVYLDDVWGRDARVLLEELCATADRKGDLATPILDALEARIRHAPFEPASARAAHAAMTLLSEGDRRTSDLARALGVSERHLRRTFHATVGYAPKTFARIARFQRALALSKARVSWTEIARRTGYFDQAHLIADFRALALRSPEELVRGRAIDRSLVTSTNVTST